MEELKCYPLSIYPTVFCLNVLVGIFVTDRSANPKEVNYLVK